MKVLGRRFLLINLALQARPVRWKCPDASAGRLSAAIASPLACSNRASISAALTLAIKSPFYSQPFPYSQDVESPSYSGTDCHFSSAYLAICFQDASHFFGAKQEVSKRRYQPNNDYRCNQQICLISHNPFLKIVILSLPVEPTK